MKRIADLLRTTKNWMLGHKLRAAILALALVFTAPWPARAQFGLDPCCALLVAGLSSIQSALTKVVGGGLNQILGVDQAMQQFQQAVVWPQNLINQARNLVGVLQGNFNQIQNLMHIPVNSATLPLSQQLEQVILSRNPNQIAQTSGAYTALYGPVPAATAASPQVLNMVDMTDAAAQAAMKRAIEIDALADSGTAGSKSAKPEHSGCGSGQRSHYRSAGGCMADPGERLHTVRYGRPDALTVDRSCQRQRRHQDGGNEHHQPAPGFGQSDAAPVSHE